MRTVVHRSENLTIQLHEEQRRLDFEIRFSSSSARGYADGACPKCGEPGTPVHWELEGPDGAGNTVWLTCGNADCDGGGFRWSRPVVFTEGWLDR